MVGLESALARQRILEAQHKGSHFTFPFAIAIATDEVHQFCELIVVVHFILDIVEINLITPDNARLDFTTGNITSITSTPFVGLIVVVTGIGDFVREESLRIVIGLRWYVHCARTGQIGGDVIFALGIPRLRESNTQLNQKAVDLALELGRLLPRANVLVDLVEQVVQAVANVLEITGAILTIAIVFAILVGTRIPWAVHLVGKGAGVGNVRAVCHHFAIRIRLGLWWLGWIVGFLWWRFWCCVWLVHGWYRTRRVVWIVRC